MSFGVQVFDTAGTLVWDSRTVAGAVVADILSYSSGGSGTHTYPDFAGRSVDVIHLTWSGHGGQGAGITTDTSLGYPRVTVASRTFPRNFIVIVY